MEAFQEVGLQGAKELVHQGRVIEVKGVLTVVPLEEIPIEQGGAIGSQTAMKLQQLG